MSVLKVFRKKQSQWRFQSKYLFIPGIYAGAAVLVSSCAHTGPLRDSRTQRDPVQTLESLCSIGLDVEEASGTLQMRAKSPEASGQFPAIVTVNSKESLLHLEVTNPIGGTEARVQVKGAQYLIEAGRGKKLQKQEGNGTWGGIPLSWAVDLFLGKVPCPTRKVQTVDFDQEGRLRATVSADLAGAQETFVYRVEFPEDEGRAWPTALEWSRSGVFQTAVSFQFASPEEGTRSPTRWEAVSDRGEVKAKWRSREIRRSQAGEKK